MHFILLESTLNANIKNKIIGRSALFSNREEVECIEKKQSALFSNREVIEFIKISYCIFKIHKPSIKFFYEK